jgi:flavin reductase (DIM6/NTAB) family NADH-FMN oxidoreductase RutF
MCMNATTYPQAGTEPAQRTNPAILYFGTPVVLISTTDRAGRPNLAPMSSAWWLGHNCMLGLAANSQTTINLRERGECVLNLPSEDLVDHVDRLARTTGSDPVPESKLQRGYRHVADKFGEAWLTPIASELVAPPRVRECPVQMEARLVDVHPVGSGGGACAIEVRVERVHAHEAILAEPDRVDPDAWRPLIMSFQHFYGLSSDRLRPSRLAEIPEELYR